MYASSAILTTCYPAVNDELLVDLYFNLYV